MLMRSGRLAAIVALAAFALVPAASLSPSAEARAKAKVSPKAKAGTKAKAKDARAKAQAQARATAALVARGRYLSNLGGCNDCHTPGYFFGKPDMTRQLAGSEVGFEIPGLGVFHGPNLTPDNGTGLGGWTDKQITNALTKGVRPDGRMLAPIMPWRALAGLTPQDTKALVAYLRSIPTVQNKVPGPFGASEKPTSFVMKIIPPAGK
jgi:mono/diheme cytochrome c family protein